MLWVHRSSTSVQRHLLRDRQGWAHWAEPELRAAPYESEGQVTIYLEGCGREKKKMKVNMKHDTATKRECQSARKKKEAICSPDAANGWRTFQNVQTNSAQFVYVWVKDFGDETHFWSSHGILLWQKKFQFKLPSFKRWILRSGNDDMEVAAVWFVRHNTDALDRLLKQTSRFLESGRKKKKGKANITNTGCNPLTRVRMSRKWLKKAFVLMQLWSCKKQSHLTDNSFHHMTDCPKSSKWVTKEPHGYESI